MKGGGVLGIAYAGALKVLEEAGIVKGLQRTAGTSAGSIVAMLVALKYTAAEIYDIVNTLDFKSFEDGFNPLRELTKDSLYKGEFALEWLQKVVSDKTGGDITFGHLQNKGFLGLTVVSTNLRKRAPRILDAGNFPNVSVPLGVRSSMGIPFFFEPVSYPYDQPQTLDVDGGTMYNYPITVFDYFCDPSETLGLFLYDVNGKSDYPIETGNLPKFTAAVLDCVLSAQDEYIITNPEIMKRTIVIDDLGISATDFGITDAQKEALFQSGVNSAQAYLNNLQKS
jgi:NTE family protein